MITIDDKWSSLTLDETEFLIEVPSPEPPGTEVIEVESPGPKGDTGPPGQSSSQTLVAGATMAAGTPVYVSAIDGKVYPADPTSVGTSRAIAALLDGSSAGFPVQIGVSFITVADWTAIAGSQFLQVGQSYFLAPNGQISTSFENITGQYLVLLGTATTPDTLSLDIQIPILL
jgi:hypothetical protein